MSVTIDTQAVRARVRSRLLGRAGVDLERRSAPERRLRVRQEVLAVLREERAILPAGTITDVVNQVSDEVVGLGPLERLLRDPEVSEVMVNGADDVFVERKGRLERVEGLVFEGLVDKALENDAPPSAAMFGPWRSPLCPGFEVPHHIYVPGN